MSHESLVDSFLRETGMAASTLAVLSGINRTRVSECLRGKSSFTGPESILLSDLIHELRSILSDLHPVPIDWTDCAAIRRLVAYKREGIRWSLTVDGEISEQAAQ
jgi:hypothetical protein